MVLRLSGAFDIDGGEIGLGLGEALDGGLAKPFGGRGEVLRDAAAEPVERTQAVLAGGVAGLGAGSPLREGRRPVAALERGLALVESGPGAAGDHREQDERDDQSPHTAPMTTADYRREGAAVRV